jgi:hypothetical protein
MSVEVRAALIVTNPVLVHGPVRPLCRPWLHQL